MVSTGGHSDEEYAGGRCRRVRNLQYGFFFVDRLQLFSMGFAVNISISVGPIATHQADTGKIIYAIISNFRLRSTSVHISRVGGRRCLLVPVQNTPL